jgi:hypothetical protein
MIVSSRYLYCVLISLSILSVHGNVGLSQVSNSESSVTMQRIMATALSRCYSKINGVTKITFEPPTNEEFSEVKSLGEGAVAPLAAYLDLEQKDGFTQLFAVKFLMAIGSPSTLGPLKRAFREDQWEVTRAAALSGIFGESQIEARPFVESALTDRSNLVRGRAHDLWVLYQSRDK